MSYDRLRNIQYVPSSLDQFHRHYKSDGAWYEAFARMSLEDQQKELDAWHFKQKHPFKAYFGNMFDGTNWEVLAITFIIAVGVLAFAAF